MPHSHLLISLPGMVFIAFVIIIPVWFVLALARLAFGGGSRRRRRFEDAEAKARILERAWRSMDAMEKRVDNLEAALLERHRAAGKPRQ